MENQNGGFKVITALLSDPFPEPEAIKKNRIKAGLWMAAIESLESRLMLGNILHHNHWWKAPKRVNHPRGDDSLISLRDIQQASFLLEAEIVRISSRPPSTQMSSASTLPMKNILHKILSFKANLCSEPVFKMLFLKAADGVVKSTVQAFPEIHGVPKVDMQQRAWYKYYGQYSSLLNLVSYKSDILASVIFKKDWLSLDDGVLILLYSYTVKAKGNALQFEALLAHSQGVVNKTPSLAPLHNALDAIYQRAKHS